MTIRYIAGILPGWIVIMALLYVYVVKQAYLVRDSWLMIGVIVLGVALSFLCSSVEMAIASLGESELERIAAEGEQLRQQQATLSQSEYIKRQRRILKLMLVYYEAGRLNAPIVIFNNVANILIASFIPLALATADVRPLHVVLPILGPLSLPWAGSETLTFVVTIFFLVVFGEVVPKWLGR